MYDAASEARNAAAQPISAGLASRPRGTFFEIAAMRVGVAVEQVGLFGLDHADHDRVDPHLAAPIRRPACVVRLSKPAFAAPYAAVPGVGRRPLTLEMLTIEPPDGLAPASPHWRAAKPTAAPSRLSSMILVLNFADASAAGT